MDTVIFFLKLTAVYLIDALQLLLLIRVIVHLFDPTEDTKIYTFLYLLTEPFITPIRKLFQRMHWFEGTPLDMPFFFTVIILAVLQALLYAL